MTTVTDSFNRADNASSLGTADTGETWTALAGTWGIATNKARCFTAGAHSFAVVNPGYADLDVKVTVSGTLNAGGGICFRASDASNLWFVECDSGQTILYKVVAGSFTGVVTGMATFSTGDEMTVSCAGSSITVKKNGTTIGSTSDSFNATATKHGLRDFNGVIRLDDFSTTELAFLSLNAADSLSEQVLAASAMTLGQLMNAAAVQSEQALAGTLGLNITLAGSVSAEQVLAGSLTLYQPLTSWTGNDDARFDVDLDLHGDLFLEPTEDPPPVGMHVSDFDILSVDLPSPTTVDGVPLNWTPTTTRDKWGRYQIIIDGHDVTHYRGKRTRVISWASNDPFGDADAALSFPQITEYDDLDSVSWWRAGAPVTIRRRKPNGDKTWVWTGIVASTEPGRVMHCLGTLYQLDLYKKTRRFFDEPGDVGHRIAKAINIKAVHHGFKGTRCEWVTTGIETREQGLGDPMLTSYIQNVLSTAMTAGGDQWTLALVHPRTPKIKLRDSTTEDWTVSCGAPGVREALVRDYTTAANVEYGSGSSGDCTWENRKFPHLRHDDAPLYPLTLPAVFNPGDSGFAEFADELRDNGYTLDSEDTYLAADVDEVEDFQEAAGITVDGVVGPQTWAAAFQVGAHQGDLDWAWVKPLAIDPSVEPWLYNAQGAVIGDNPEWDSSVMRVEKFTMFGDRVPKKLGKRAAKQMLARDNQPGWVGTLTLTTDPAEGSRRDIRAGQNIVLKHHRGSNRLLHIARAEWDEGSSAMTLTVDTKARDLMTVASVHQRNRDVANPVGQPKPGWRTGTQVSDRVQWACEDGAGKIPFHAQFGGLWSVLPIPAGRDGVIAKVALAAGSGLTRSMLRDLLTDPLPEAYHGFLIPGATKLAVAVFSDEVTSNMLANTVGNPFARQDTDDPWEAHADQLTDWGCLYAAGGPDNTGGFYPHLDPGDGTTDHLSGRFVDAAGFPFESKKNPYVFVALYTKDSCYIGGRMYPGAPV